MTDYLAQIQLEALALGDPEKPLLVGKISNLQLEDTPQSHQFLWENNSLLVSYVFPEHEELEPSAGFDVVTWKDGRRDNLKSLV